MKRCSYLADTLHKEVSIPIVVFFSLSIYDFDWAILQINEICHVFTKTAESLHCSLCLTTVSFCFSLLCYGIFCHKTIISQNYKSTLSKY